MEQQPQQVLWGAVSSLHHALGHGRNALGGVWHLLTWASRCLQLALWAPHSLCGSASQRGFWGLGDVWLMGPQDSGWVWQAEVQKETCTVPRLFLDVPGHTYMKEQGCALSPCPKHVLRVHLIQRTIEGIFFLKCRFLYRGPAKSPLVTKGWAERPRWGILGHEKVGIGQPGEGFETLLWLSGVKGGL